MENIEEWVEKLKKSNKIIIVEGMKDKKALQAFGIKNIFHLKEPLFKAVEKIVELEKEAIILTDFDTEGKKLYGKLSKDLQRLGIKIDKIFREWLMKNTKLSHIEGFKTYFERETFKNKQKM